MVPGEYAQYVTAVRFRRALFGYRPADVDQHLRAVTGWFSLAGLDEPLRARRHEAEAEAARIVDAARLEADEITATARREADALLAEARREAELERRGKSRIGRPVGGGRSVTRFEPLARR